MKKTGDNTEALKKRQEILAKELETSKDKTEALRKKLEKAKEIFGENSEEAKRLQTQLNNAKTAEQKIADEIEDTNKKLKEQKDAFDKVAEKAEKAGQKLQDAGKKMSVVSAGIAAAGGASIAAFNEVDEGADNVLKATGATGEAAEELEAVYGKVAGSIVGDFADIGSAVGEINTRFGYTGEKLEKASLDFEKFAAITGVDAKDAVQAVSRALNDAGIPLDEYDTLLDQLAKAGQAAGIDVTTLADSLSTNGSIMRSMGFNTQETIALLSQFELSGADASTMLTGMKRAMANWAEEGKNGNKEFEKTVQGIKDGSISAGDALDIFGTKAGPMLVDAIKSGKFEYQDMLGVIKNSEGTVSKTFDATVDGGYEMELAMQNAKLAAAEVGDTLSTSLTPFVEGATEKLKGFASWWGKLDSGTQKTIITVAGVIAAIGPVLILLGTVASSISKITTLMSAMRSSTLLASAAAKVHAAAQWLVNTSIAGCPVVWIIAAIAALIAIVVLLVKNWDKVKAAGEKCWNAIKNSCAKAWAGVKNAWGNVKQWFGEKVDGIKAKFAQVKNAIVQPFKTAIDKVKGFFSGLKLKLPHIKLPHFKLTGKFSLSPPSVPKLGVEWYAKGAIFTKPTIFNTPYGMKGVGDVAGGEAVLPIEKLRGFIGTEIERHSQTAGLMALAESIRDLADRPIGLNVNGRQFATAVAGDADSVNGFRSRLTERGLAL
jgi:phage-related minor tail protein